MMNGMSFSETVFLFLLALIIFGPKKLPEIARQVGKYMNEFKRASNEFKAQIEQEISNLEVEKRQTILPPSPPPEGDDQPHPARAAHRIQSRARRRGRGARSRCQPSSRQRSGSRPGLLRRRTALRCGAAPVSSDPTPTSPDAVSPTTQGSHV